MRGICSGCNCSLTEENTTAAFFKRQSGKCRDCHNTRRRELYKEDPSSVHYSAAKRRLNFREEMLFEKRSPRGKFNHLKTKMKKEGTPKADDLLWNFHFYSEFIKGGVCHYCFGPLEPYGHGLDRVENKIGHVCYNVVLCCRQCNRIKGNDISYENMMLLAPALREIRRRRDAIGDSSGNRQG